MKKRIFALIMAMCLALSLLPASVFAENESGSDVVYGKYGTGTTWTQDNKIDDGSITYDTDDGNTITLSKKATPLGNNTYQIDLEVKTTQTTTTTPPGAAATVLVLDTSGSMDYCSDCGQENSHADGCKYYNRNWRDNSIKNGQTRLAAAKEAAISFLDAYKGDTAGVGRYVSLVSFAGSASVKCDWQDVSTTAGYNAVVRAIRSLSANGGTNLDAGLSTATNQFTKSAVSGISKDSKNVIALTDGIPKYYGNNTSQHGSYGCPDTNKATAASAAKLKESASLYTVCFGAANDRCWTAGSTHDWEWTPWGAQEVKHDTEGPLVGDFLRDSIATSATADTTYAYNAANSAELFKAFKAITTSITTGISSGTVNDPMGPNISVTSKPDDLKLKDGSTYTWELANGVKSTDGSKTTYTYQLSYTVKLDTTGEGFDENAHYPTNGKTTFTSGNKTFEFPVPGVKGTIPSYQVKYEYKGDVPTGALAQLPADETHKMHTDVTVAAEPKLDGYVFSGWTTTDAAVSSDGKFKMPGQNVTLTGSWTIRSDLSYTVNYYWNGTTDSVAPSKTVDGQTFGAIVTEKPAAIDGYTAVSADSKNLTIGTGKNVINFYYYQNVTLTANSGTVPYDGKEHSVSGFTGAPDGADFSAVTVGAKGMNVGTYDAKFAENTVGTVDATAKYIVTEAHDGKLTITPVGGIVVTITGNTDSRPYSGAEQFVTGYTVSTSNPLYTEADFTFTGTAKAKGTDAGTYMMGLTPAQFENTNPNFENVTFIVTDGKLTITPRSVKLTSETAEKVYDGQPLTRPDVAVTGDGFVAGEVSDIRATGTVTNVSDGEQPNAIVYTTSAGFKPGNYSIEKDEGTLKITPVTDKVTVTITGNTDSKIYDGNEHSVTGYTTAIDNQLYTVSDFTFTGEAIAKGTDADSYKMGLKAEQFENNNTNFTNVEFAVTDGSLQINPRSVKLTSATDEKVYDGQPLTNGVVTVSGDGFVKGEGAAYNVTGSQTNVGSSDNTFTYMLNPGTKAGNYAIEQKEGTLTVTPVTAEVTVTITGNKSTVTYNGAEQSVTGYKVESISNPLYTAADFAFSGTASVTGTDAGSYPMGLKAEQFQNTSKNFTNVKFVVNDGELTINPMPLTITAGSDSKAYNGTPLTNDTFTRTSLAAGDTLASVTVTGSQTDVGSSDNVASDAKLVRGDRDVTANYAIEYLPGTLTVTKNESAKLTAEAYKGVYDGGEHDAVVKTALSDLVDDSVWTYSYSLDGEHYTDEMPQVKNVGAYPVWVKATNDNYVDLVTVVTAEVTPATVLVTADSHEWIIAVKDTCVSDPEPALTYQAESPVAGETPAFSGELSREPGAERGKTYQILQGDLALADGENFLASNYVLQFVPGELTVKARDITITKTVDVTKAFVGDKLTYTITVTNTGDVDLQDVAVVDEMLGIEQVIGELKAGESWTQQFTYAAQESDAGKTLVNTAVTGTKDEKTFDQVDSDGTEITQKPVPTGDQSMVGLWTATLLISAAGAAIILARKSRRSK